MCGIVFVSKTDGTPARKAVWKRYLAQKTRGMRGFGYIAVKDGKIVNVGRGLHDTDIEKTLKEELGNEILFHHRFPTSTENMVEATHPIEVKNPMLQYDYYLVHNGIISNDSELKLEHEKKGFVYSTLIRYKTYTRISKYSAEEFNDSEALAIEVALVLDGKKETVDTKGSVAFICIQAEKETGKVIATFFGRNSSNPLKVHREKNFMSITSEGAGEEIPVNKLFRMDSDTGIMTESDLNISGYSTYDDEEYGRYHSQGDYSNDWGSYKGGVWTPHHERRAGFDTSGIQQYLPIIQEITDPEDEVLHPDDIAAEKAYREYTEIEDIVEGLERDLEVLFARQTFLEGIDDGKGVSDILIEIGKKKKEKELFEAEMYAIQFDAGAFDPTN